MDYNYFLRTHKKKSHVGCMIVCYSVDFITVFAAILCMKMFVYTSASSTHPS